MVPVPRLWPGVTVVCIATGPSLTAEDVAATRGFPTVAINDAYRLAPWADVLLACDADWWAAHEYVRGFAGHRWTQDRQPRHWRGRWPAESAANGLHVTRSIRRTGVSWDPDVLHDGWNSGFLGLNFACLAGATTVILLGYDLGVPAGAPSHWFGDHPTGLQKPSPYAFFRKAFENAAPDIAAHSIRVLNCSRSTSLTCFERMELHKCLSTLEIFSPSGPSSASGSYSRTPVPLLSA